MSGRELLTAAAAAWLAAAGCLAGIESAPTSMARGAAADRVWQVSGVVVLVLLGVVAAAVIRHRWRWASVVLVPAAVAVIASAAAGAAAASVHAAPLAAWSDARATGVVQGRVSGPGRQPTLSAATSWRSSSAVQVPVMVDAVTARGEAATLAATVLVRLPAHAVVPVQGERVQVGGRLLPAAPRSGVAAIVQARSITTIAPPGIVDRLAESMRAGLRGAVSGAPPDAGALVAGLAIGDESTQPATLVADMRGSGLAHLTAVSGGNIAIVLGLVLAVTALLRLPLVVRIGAAGGALAYYVLLVGPQPSVVRAAVMGVVALIGLSAGGRRAGPHALAVAVILLVIVRPYLALSWGFALSALATAGLVLLAPVLRDRLATARLTRRWPPAMQEATALTVAAQLATAPVLAAMGGTVGWAGVPANLLAMPAVAPVTILGLAAAVVSPALPGVAHLLGSFAAWPAGWIARVAAVCAHLPLARLPLPSGWAGAAVVIGGFALVLIARWAAPRLLGDPVPRRLRHASVGLLLVGAALLALAPPSRRGWPPPGWLAIMCDVGQGDAILLNAGPGSAVVVDAGPDPDRVDGCLRDAGVSEVPAIVLTHFHADHVDGLAGVLRGRSVATVLATPIRDPAADADRVDAVLAAAGLRVQPITAGDTRSVGQVSWRALWPRRILAGGPNNASVVLLAQVGGRRFLLCGDVEPEAQAAIGMDVAAAHIDVIKVPHHGSRYQDPRLPQWAPAAIALVSVGAGNDYGHPAPATITAWQQAGALVARTDRDGDVAVVATSSGVGVVARHGMLPAL